MKKCSVIIIAYDGDRWLSDCLESLSEGNSTPMDLLLLDNAGNTVIDDMVSRYPGLQVLKCPHPLGFAAANNFVLQHTDKLGEFVLFLNQDTISMPGWIDDCIGAFDADPLLGAVSPLIRTYDDSGWDPAFLACLGPDQLASLGEESSELMYCKNIPAPALIVRTDVLKKSGPFDPVFGSYYEDYDLCRRIRQAGFHIAFSRSSRIRHYSGSATKGRAMELERMKLIIRNRVLYMVREHTGLRFWKALSYFLIDFPVRLVRGIIGTPSSQPPIVVISAYRDLLHISNRLFFKANDEMHWKKYLQKIYW